MAIPSDQSNGHDNLRKAVFQAIGQSVVLYQNIEFCLKSMLPHLIPVDGYVCDDPLVEAQKLLASRETLGPLMGRLKRTFHSPYPESFSEYLAQIVSHRNQLVHTFVRQPFGSLSDPSSCEAALRHLNAQHAYAVPLIHALQEIANAMVEATKGQEGTS